MIQISNEDALFILDELNKRAEHQMAAYNGIDPDLQGVINDLDAQLNATLPVQEEAQEAPAAAVAAFVAGESHEQFDEDAAKSTNEEPEAPSA